MPDAATPPPSQATVHGVINKVPCAHCGQHMDLTELDKTEDLDTGVSIECDGCGKNSEIVAIRKVVVVRQS